LREGARLYGGKEENKEGEAADELLKGPRGKEAKVSQNS